ncbi:MAG: sigma-70 family RNA polymerase sigma factor [Bacteroidia bacterium]
MRFGRLSHIRSLSDEQLVATYRSSGDKAFMGELFERYTHVVFLICMKYLRDEQESEDMTMRIFEKLIDDLRKYEVRSFSYWLHTVVKNQCLLHLDQRRRLRHKADAYHTTEQALLDSATGNPLEETEHQLHEDALQRMEAALVELKPEQRICLELFYLQRKSYQEVADQTGYSLKQVKSYIQNGKRNLKINLEASSFPSTPQP